MYSKTFLIGRLAADAEMRSTSCGNITNARIITTEAWTDKQGQKQEKTEGHRIVFFGNLADVAAQYGKKGTLMFIEGVGQTSEYEKNGEKRYSHEVRVKVMKLLSGPRENHSYQGDNQQQGNHGQNQGNYQSQPQGGHQGQNQGSYQSQPQGGYQGQNQGGYQSQPQGGYQGQNQR